MSLRCFSIQSLPPDISQIQTCNVRENIYIYTVLRSVTSQTITAYTCRVQTCIVRENMHFRSPTERHAPIDNGLLMPMTNHMHG